MLTFFQKLETVARSFNNDKNKNVKKLTFLDENPVTCAGSDASRPAVLTASSAVGHNASLQVMVDFRISNRNPGSPPVVPGSKP